MYLEPLGHEAKVILHISGSATKATAMVATFFPSFTIRYGLGYWEGEQETNVEYMIAMENNPPSVRKLSRLLETLLETFPDQECIYAQYPSGECRLARRQHEMTPQDKIGAISRGYEQRKAH